MGNMKPVFLIFIFLTCSVIYAHKDRIEFPQRLIFTLKTKKVIQFNYADSKLEEFCKEIVDGKKEVSEVKLFYKTGEVVTVQSDGRNWNLFKITYKGKSLYVPVDKLKKIREIHFRTLFLFWSGESNAFSSRYLCLRFDIGKERSFGVFPNLELHFSNNKFSKSEVWSQTSENSRQGKAF